MDWALAMAAAGFICGWWLRGKAHTGLAASLPVWHRGVARLWWRWRSRRRGGRPRISDELISLIREMSRDNPL